MVDTASVLTTGRITGTWRFSDSPAVSVNCSEVKVEPTSLELALSHRPEDLAQKLRASTNSAKSIVGYMGFWVFLSV